MGDETVFARNLEALRDRHATLAEALEATSTEEIERVTGPRGAISLRQDGVSLGSAYDPVREGEQLAATMAEQPADVMVAVGLGLGEQLGPYLERNPGTLIVYEPSLARLRAALERTSIEAVLADHADVHFVADDDVFRRVLAARYTPGLRIRAFPHPALMRLDPGAVARIVGLTRDTKEIVDIRRLTSIEMLAPWALLTARNGRRIAETPQLGRLHDCFADRPAVVVAAGPSLDKQLPLLREIQDRVVVIAIGQATRALVSAGIRPHLVHLLESRDVSHQLTDCGDTRDFIVAPSADADPSIFDVPCRARFTVTTHNAEMGAWIGRATDGAALPLSIGGGTVAQGAVGIAVLLGCRPIALIGQDLAFTDNRAYARGTAYDFVEIDVSEDGKWHYTNMDRKADLLGAKEKSARRKGGPPEREIVWVDGWNEGEKVATWRAYQSFIEQYREMGAYLNAHGRALVNCTEGGARIPELEHLSFRDFAARHAAEAFDARATLIEAYDAAPRHGLDAYRETIDTTRERLEQVERAARRGERFLEKARDRLIRAKDDQQRVKLLRGIARLEKKVRHRLDAIPWLDSLVQPEIYNAIAAVRRTERQDPTDEDLANEAAFLFRAATNGVGRARQWLETFEASFEDGALEAPREITIPAPTIVRRTDPDPPPAPTAP